jgi:hypothetical protein
LQQKAIGMKTTSQRKVAKTAMQRKEQQPLGKC